MKLVMGNRREGHVRHDAQGSVENTPGGTGWVSEAERLRGDCGETVRGVHEERRKRKQAGWDGTRAQRAVRQEKLDTKRREEGERADTHAAQIVGSGRRNASSVRYNVINHVYSDSRSAALARFRDDRTKYSAICRSRELLHRGNMCGYNIISGTDRPADLVPAMQPPAFPSE